MNNLNKEIHKLKGCCVEHEGMAEVRIGGEPAPCPVCGGKYGPIIPDYVNDDTAMWEALTNLTRIGGFVFLSDGVDPFNYEYKIGKTGWIKKNNRRTYGWIKIYSSHKCHRIAIWTAWCEFIKELTKQEVLQLAEYNIEESKNKWEKSTK